MTGNARINRSSPGRGGGRAIAALLALAFAGGCTNTLVFGERASFNLAIHVNDNPITPLQVNAGLKRAVVGIVPPNDVTEVDNQKVPVGEAVSLFSGFNLGYERPELASPFSGKLTIRTQFASGKAAIAVAGDPQTVREIVDVRLVNVVPTALQTRREAAADFVKTLNEDQLNALAHALGRDGPDPLGNILDAISAAETDETFAPIAENLKNLFQKEV